jgi:hypothetical protein
MVLLRLCSFVALWGLDEPVQGDPERASTEEEEQEEALSALPS